jgi:hypothetical protein
VRGPSGHLAQSHAMVLVFKPERGLVPTQLPLMEDRRARKHYRNLTSAWEPPTLALFTVHGPAGEVMEHVPSLVNVVVHTPDTERAQILHHNMAGMVVTVRTGKLPCAL